jgi:hypothetical protein
MTSWTLPQLSDLEKDTIQTLVVKLGVASKFIDFDS